MDSLRVSTREAFVHLKIQNGLDNRHIRIGLGLGGPTHPILHPLALTVVFLWHSKCSSCSCSNNKDASIRDDNLHSPLVSYDSINICSVHYAGLVWSGLTLQFRVDFCRSEQGVSVQFGLSRGLFDPE